MERCERMEKEEEEDEVEMRKESDTEKHKTERTNEQSGLMI